MGNPAGQRPDGFQPLALVEVALQFQFMTDVAGDLAIIDDLPLNIVNGKERHLGVITTAIFALRKGASSPGFVLLHGRPRRTLGGVHSFMLQQRQSLPHHRFRRVAAHSLIRGVDILNRTRQVGDHNGLTRLTHHCRQQPVCCLTPLQRDFGLFPFSNIARNTEDYLPALVSDPG